MPASHKRDISDQSTARLSLRDRLLIEFQLTPAEADIALALASAHSAKSIARDRDVSHHTVRTQIKAIYAKLGVNRHVELVRLLHMFEAPHSKD